MQAAQRGFRAVLCDFIFAKNFALDKPGDVGSTRQFLSRVAIAKTSQTQRSSKRVARIRCLVGLQASSGVNDGRKRVFNRCQVPLAVGEYVVNGVRADGDAEPTAQKQHGEQQAGRKTETKLGGGE